MYKESQMFQRPSDENQLIWRYLDFTKFVSLLIRRELFFPCSEELPDKFEGSLPQRTIALRPATHDMSAIHAELRKRICISSWHMNEYESEAMWKLYVKSAKGVAVQSTFARLRQSFAQYDEDILIGMVRYIDYRTDYIPEANIFFTHLHKRRSFELERELRAITLPSRHEPEMLGERASGLYVPVDLDVLVERVFVSPTAPPWFTDLVRSVMIKLGVAKEVVQSSLANDPLF